MSSDEDWEIEDGAFALDGATPIGDGSQRAPRSDAHDTGESDAVGSGAESDVRAEKSPSKRHANGKSAGSRKRGRHATSSRNDDDDFESQPSITKWFRQVPGPLHDVMKKQHLDLQQSLDDEGVPASGRSSGHIVHISTVFDHGAWVDMCDFLGMATTAGELYGGIKMSALKHTIAFVHEDLQDDDQSTQKVPRLLVLVKSMRYVDEEIVAVFHDPSGEIDGYFHRDIVEQVGPALVNGTAALLRDVAVFTPSSFGSSGANKRYLNITPRNVEAIFPATTVATAMESIVRTFNESQAKLIKADIEEAEEALDDESLAPQLQRVLAPANVRTTTTELSFISQRQVVQRHQPVRPDPSDTGADDVSGGDSRKKSKKKKAKEVPSGLGRWQWHTLAQKKPAVTNDDGEEAPSEPRRTFPPGRFTQLLSQHLQARRTAASSVTERPTELSASQLARPVPQNPASTSAKAVRFTTVQETTIDEEDDDDEW